MRTLIGLVVLFMACGEMTMQPNGRGPVAGAPDWCPNAQDAIDTANGVGLSYPMSDGTAYPTVVYYDACSTIDNVTGFPCFMCWDKARSGKVLLGGVRCSQDTTRLAAAEPNNPNPPNPPADLLVVCVASCGDTACHY